VNLKKKKYIYNIIYNIQLLYFFCTFSLTIVSTEYIKAITLSCTNQDNKHDEYYALLLFCTCYEETVGENKKKEYITTNKQLLFPMHFIFHKSRKK
jgi:hypothetical protein